jgi:hypothetical protein
MAIKTGEWVRLMTDEIGKSLAEITATVG